MDLWIIRYFNNNNKWHSNGVCGYNISTLTILTIYLTIIVTYALFVNCANGFKYYFNVYNTSYHT